MPDNRYLIRHLLLIAFILRLAAAFYWHEQASSEENYFRLEDSHSYWVLAQQIAGGQPYQYGSPDASVFRTPLFPLFLAPLTWISDNYYSVLAARCLGAILGTLAVWGVIRLAGSLGGSRAAVAAGLMAAFYPSAIGMSVVILSEMLFVPLMVWQVWLWQRVNSHIDGNDHHGISAQVALAVVSGVFAGLACLARPSWLLYTPCLLIAGVFIGGRRWLRVQVGILAMAGMCLTMMPWWIRNYGVTEKVVLTTLQIGPSLMDGLRPEATGASDSHMNFMLDIMRRQREVDQSGTQPLESTFEWRVNRLATQTATHWALSDPAAFLRLSIQKFKRTWSLWPDGNELASNPMRFLITAGSFLVLVLAILASFRYRRLNPTTLAILWLPCLYFTALHMVFVGSVRYREPAVFLLIALAGCAIAEMVHSLLKHFRLAQSVTPCKTGQADRQQQSAQGSIHRGL